jgi:hypothetical protein
MNWEFIFTTLLLLLIVVVIVAPLLMVMMLAYTKAKISMYAEIVSKHEMQFHPSSDDFDWSMFEGEAK